MVHVDPEVRAAYQEAWDRWQKQLQTMHRFFLGEEPLDPPRLKGLLNREARAKDAYDAARLRLLGIPPAAPGGRESRPPPDPARPGPDRPSRVSRN